LNREAEGRKRVGNWQLAKKKSRKWKADGRVPKAEKKIAECGKEDSRVQITAGMYGSYKFEHEGV